MSLQILHLKGCPLDQQKFTWKDLIQQPISKLDDDAYTRIRIILMNGIETEALRFSHFYSRINFDQRLHLAKVRRVEQHQAILLSSLLPPDQSPLETALTYQQTAIEIIADLTQKEPDRSLAQIYRFNLLENVDILYRLAALLDRLEGKDADNLLQNNTDILPGRPISQSHRTPEEDLRMPYDKAQVAPLTRIHALILLSTELHLQDLYSKTLPLYADPVARQLFAEIMSIQEQQITQYESISDPTESWLGQWLLHEANEVYTYYSCVEAEKNPRVKAIWERFLEYELGHFHSVVELFQKIEKRDAAEILPQLLQEPLRFEDQRLFVRSFLREESNLRVRGSHLISKKEKESPSYLYREYVNSQGSPSETVAAGYRWAPGTELSKEPNKSHSSKRRVA